jgi:inhibitor of KinA sporulation pathway (predicted exonuclease)
MIYIVVDLEATCWEDRSKSPNEIIEIGAVMVNEYKEQISEFDTFVKPIIHTQLSDFCTQLTSITQTLVDSAPLFPQAIAGFQNWITSHSDEYVLCSWGFYDKKQFENDCLLHNLPADWIKAHWSIKHQYSKIKNMKPMGMEQALAKELLTLEGTHHRGIDDAKNIAKIFIKYFDHWGIK